MLSRRLSSLLSFCNSCFIAKPGGWAAISSWVNNSAMNSSSIDRLMRFRCRSRQSRLSLEQLTNMPSDTLQLYNDFIAQTCFTIKIFINSFFSPSNVLNIHDPESINLQLLCYIFRNDEVYSSTKMVSWLQLGGMEISKNKHTKLQLKSNYRRWNSVKSGEWYAGATTAAGAW